MQHTFKRVLTPFIVLAACAVFFIASAGLALSFSSQGDQDVNTDLLDTTQDTALKTNLALYGSHTWDIAVDPNDSNFIAIATYYTPNGGFWSLDQGATWSTLPAGSDHGPGHDVEIAPDGTVFMLLNDLLVSSDRMETYDVPLQLGTGAGTMMYAEGISTLVVTQNGDVHASADNGKTFTTETVCENETIWSVDASSAGLYALCYNYTTEKASLYNSTAPGAGWTNIPLSDEIAGDAEKIAINPVSKYLYLIPSSLGGGTYVSKDTGTSFTKIDGFPASGHLTFDTNGVLYSGSYYSTNGGADWTVISGLEDSTGNHLVVPDPSDPNVLYDTSVPGFGKRLAGEKEFTYSVDGITGVEVTSISQQPDTKDVVWVATQNGPAMTSNFTTEFPDSPDWSYVTLDNYNSSGYDAVWADGDIVVYSSSMQLEYSADGGSTWTQSKVDMTLPGAVFQFAHGGDTTLYGAVGPNTPTDTPKGDVIMSEDNGANWTSTGSGMAMRSVAVASDGVVYAGAYAGGLYKYDSTWTELENAPSDVQFRAISGDPDDANIIYAVASGETSHANAGLWKSVDGGDAWEQMDGGMDVTGYSEFHALALQKEEDRTVVYISGVQNETGKGVILKSSNGGNKFAVLYVGLMSEVHKVLLFDGLTAGSSIGMADYKSQAQIRLKKNKKKVKKGKKVKLTINAKEVATKKKLGGRKMKIFKKIGKKKYKLWKKVTLNKKGKKIVRSKIKKKTKFYVGWTAKNETDEFVPTASNTVTVKVKKNKKKKKK